MVIKFRGKSVKTGEWLYGYLQKYQETHASRLCVCAASVRTWSDALLYEVIPDTVGQFTGLLDKNGKDIYEGDIIFSKKSDGRAILHKIDYNEDNAMFVARPIQGVDFDYCHIRRDWIDKYSKEVIGNVYDNPELLNNK